MLILNTRVVVVVVTEIKRIRIRMVNNPRNMKKKEVEKEVERIRIPRRINITKET